MPEYHLVPNWSDGVKETYEFRTVIFTTRSGKEQRTAERLKPRRVISFQGWVQGNAMRDLQCLLQDRGLSTITIPDPARFGIPLARSASAGAMAIQLKGDAPWLEDAKQIAISSQTQSEFVTLADRDSRGAFGLAYDSSFDIADDGGVGSYDQEFSGAYDVATRKRMMLTSALANTWEAGSVVRPAISGHLQSQLRVSFPTSNLMAFEAEVTVPPPSDPPLLTDRVLSRYAGLPVLDVQPNWSNAPEVQFSTPFETVDYERGVERHFLPIDFYTRVTQLNYSGRAREDTGKILALFSEMRGRQGEFWSPSWTDDIVPMGHILEGKLTLLVSNDALRSRNSTVNKAIMIRTVGGRIIYKTITGMQSISLSAAQNDPSFDPAMVGELANGTLTRLTLNQQFGVNVNRGNITSISWLNRSRFAADGLTIDWRTDDIAQTVVQVMSLEALE